jgi:cytochrome c-type biogenesis protein CcmE
MTRLIARMRAWALVLLAVVMAGCGGGGGFNLASGGIGGTGDGTLLATGVVSASANGFITVNGVSIDVRSAAVTVNGASAAPSELRVGMVVNVEALLNPTGGATARSVDYRADVQGVVDGIDTAARAFTVLGQRVSVDTRTVVEGGVFETLRNQWVEVSGLRGAAGELVATRIEIRPNPVGQALQLTGVVTGLDTVARSFRIGAQLVDYASIPNAGLPVGFREGVGVVVVGMLPAGSTRLFASSIGLAPTLPAIEGSHVEVEGVVTDLASIASFRVNGQLVDARSATIEGGTLDSLVNGARVEIQGRLRNGVIVASSVAIEHVPTVTIEGVAEAIDAAAGTLTVAARVIRVDASTQYQDLSATPEPAFGFATIRVGHRLLVRAEQQAGRLLATRIERHDTGTAPIGAATKVQGTIAAFVSIADFAVGALRVNAASARLENFVASDLRDGQRVEAEGVLNAGVLLATRVALIIDPATPPLAVEVEGTITAYVSPSSFRVAGQPVDASGARFTNGTQADLADGRKVTARGVLSGGVVRASQIEFHGSSVTPTTLELEGPISDFTSIASFRVEGQLVDAAQARLSNGTAADLGNGRRVHVKGPLVGGVVRAATVEIEDAALKEASAEGRITDFVSASNFKVAGRTIDASTARFERGTAADLANGRQVHVEGVLAGAVLRARKVAFE